MGEIAEDMIDGCCCSICGQYFQNSDTVGYTYTHGYPVACWDCWDIYCAYQKAEVDTF